MGLWFLRQSNAMAADPLRPDIHIIRVAHYKTNVVNPKKLPAYYENSVFIWEWSRNYLKEVKMDESGNVLKISPFLPTFTFKRPIDLKIGPDGCIYLIEWGTGYSGSNPDARLVRIEYSGGNHAPVASSRVQGQMCCSRHSLSEILVAAGSGSRSICWPYQVRRSANSSSTAMS